MRIQIAPGGQFVRMRSYLDEEEQDSGITEAYVEAGNDTA
jgi:hypothetical protein